MDLSVYLVTDSGMLPEGVTFIQQVANAIDGGVTCVQLREKHIETKDFIDRARQVKKLTVQAGIPLIINDRLDVALAVGAGLHIGQDDMDAKEARQLMGPDAIIGVSCSTVEETEKAIADGADYIGIGLCFDTLTKDTGKVAGGPRAAQPLLKAIVNAGSGMKTCLIGGINQSNVQRVRFQSGIPERQLDGVAVVSCIIAQSDAKKASSELLRLWNAPPPWTLGIKTNDLSEKEIIARVRSNRPVIHHLTNDVVKNMSANVTLAIGASPIMSECSEEFDDLAKFAGALVLNTGTLNGSYLKMYIHAMHVYNAHNVPIVYDPVACGATGFRRDTNRRLLVEGFATVIKGNQDEIVAAAGISDKLASGGVDSLGSLSLQEVKRIATEFALSTRSVVVVTGQTDIVADGIQSVPDLANSDTEQRVAVIEGGDPMMGSITGTGCSLGSVIASFVAANRSDPYAATVAACQFYKNAGDVSGKLASFKGPGSFQYLFLDALYRDTLGADIAEDEY